VGKFPGSAFARQEARSVLAHMLRLYILAFWLIKVTKLNSHDEDYKVK